MCKDPVTLTPWSGFSDVYFDRIAINPGISCSAISISLLPNSARVMSDTLNSRDLESGLSCFCMIRGRVDDISNIVTIKVIMAFFLVYS